MSTTDIDTSEQQREAFANRLVAHLIASMETLGVWLGLRLGLSERRLPLAGVSTREPFTSAGRNGW